MLVVILDNLWIVTNITDTVITRGCLYVTGLMQVLLMYGYSGASDSESAASKGLRKVRVSHRNQLNKGISRICMN